MLDVVNECKQLTHIVALGKWACEFINKLKRERKLPKRVTIMADDNPHMQRAYMRWLSEGEAEKLVNVFREIASDTLGIDTEEVRGEDVWELLEFSSGRNSSDFTDRDNFKRALRGTLATFRQEWKSISRKLRTSLAIVMS